MSDWQTLGLSQPIFGLAQKVNLRGLRRFAKLGKIFKDVLHDFAIAQLRRLSK
jgi:hypothetical protein